MPGNLSHVLPSDATLADAVERIGARSEPWLVLTDAEGRASGLLAEEDIRLGLCGRSRLHHAATSLVRPLGDCPELPLEADGRPAPWPRQTAQAAKRALLMAGGMGTRLRPLTEKTPKPLLPIDGEPLLHRLVRQVRDFGVERVYVSVLYLKDLVRDSLGDGSAFGIDVEYIEESSPLGTAGAIGMLPREAGPLIVMNGDILSDVCLEAFEAWHTRHSNQVTIASQLWKVDCPFGLAHFDGQRLERLEEKPTLRLPVNAGIYYFDESLVAEVPQQQSWDMVTWLNEVSARGIAGHFPIVERWHDIGSLAEYERLRGS